MKTIISKLVKKYNLFILLETIYIFFALVDGYKLFNDSEGYISMHMMREPIYPLFLAIFRKIFGVNIYLNIVVIVQALLMGIAIYVLVTYIVDEFEMNDFYSYIFAAIYVGISLMNRFIAGRSAMYSNSIMSEGLAYPLFLIYFRYLLDYVINKNDRMFIKLLAFSLLLISIRKQMYITLIMLILAITYACFSNKKTKKAVLAVVITLTIVVGGTRVLDNIYIKSLYGVRGTHTSDNRFLSAMIIYSTQREYGELIEDQTVRELFYNIWDICDDKGYLKSNIEKNGWFNRVSHFSNNIDNIQLRTLWNMLEEKAIEVTGNRGIEMEMLVDKYNNELISSLFVKTIPTLISTILDSFLFGLVITVSAEKEIFVIYGIFAYCIFFILVYYALKKEKVIKIFEFSALTMLSITVNVALISSMIFCQTRYTIYNMGLFYIALIVAISTFFCKK